MLIPTTVKVDRTIEQLPVRASSIEAAKELWGGCRHKYRCWRRTQNLGFRGQDELIGHVYHTRENGDSYAEHLCNKQFEQLLRNGTTLGLHTQWMGCV